MAKIEILESAQRELEAIAELHMNLVGPNSARKITDRILDSLSRLERFPLSGSLPRDAELLKSGYRYVILCSSTISCMVQVITLFCSNGCCKKN